MKQLTEILKSKLISEALKINSKSKVNQKQYHPKDKNELMELLDKLIKERGYEGDFNDIDTSKITDMSMLFTFARTKFNGDISEWDTSNVRDMRFMFCDTKFAGDISNWDVSNVEDMYNMFYGCNDFNCDLNKWNVRKVKNMAYMFDGCPLENHPPKWYNK